MTTKPSLQVTCPTCHKPVAWIPENTFRPFCSERCKMIDLGVWANEGYSIASEEDPASKNVPVDDITHLQ